MKGRENSMDKTKIDSVIGNKEEKDISISEKYKGLYEGLQNHEKDFQALETALKTKKSDDKITLTNMYKNQLDEYDKTNRNLTKLYKTELKKHLDSSNVKNLEVTNFLRDEESLKLIDTFFIKIDLVREGINESIKIRQSSNPIERFLNRDSIVICSTILSLTVSLFIIPVKYKTDLSVYIPFALGGYIMYLLLLLYFTGNERTNDKIRYEDRYMTEGSKVQTKAILRNSSSNTDLIEQYKISVSSEHYYETVMWDIGKILLTGSAASLPVAFTVMNSTFENGKEIGYGAILFSIIIYTVFLFLSKRYRASIRKFRNSTNILEEELNWLPFTYVYTLEPQSFGNPIKIWTIFVSLYGVIITSGVWIVFSM